MPNVYIFVIKVQIVHWAHCEAPLLVQFSSFYDLPLGVWIGEVQTLNCIQSYVGLILACFSQSFEALERVQVLFVLGDKRSWVGSFKI